MSTTSQEIKQELDSWFQTSGYEDIKFFVSPNLESSVDECSSDVLASIGRLEQNSLKNLSTETL